MKSDTCEFEAAVAAAVESGQWSGELRGHLDSCRDCGDLLLVSRYLTSAISSGEEDVPLPAPGLIWWRAQLAERREQAERAVAAIDLMQKLAVAVALIGLVGATLIWKPTDWGTLLMGAGLFVSTTAVLYGWIRGRI